MAFRPKTAAQIKKDFFEKGITCNAWALQNKFDPSEVYRVLNGQNKATRGKGHAIAVALGLKAPSHGSAQTENSTNLHDFAGGLPS